MSVEQQQQQQQQSSEPKQNAIAAAAGRFKEVLGNLLKERKPWSELLDRTAFSRPANFAEATGRLKKNAAYFRVNYLAFMLVVTVTCMVLNPTSLLVLGCLALLWAYFFGIRKDPIVIGGRTFSEREKFLGLTVTSAIMIFFVTSVGTILFTALGISVAVIGLHGACRVPDDLFTDEVEQQSGLLGFFTAPTSTASQLANVV
jgi:hypothetical protein